MRAPPPLRLVLFDFDGVLARYDRHARLAHLAQATGRTRAEVETVLFGSGLERAYDSGMLDTGTYLQQLGDALGCNIDAATWIEARIAATAADAVVLELVAALGARVPVGVLTNNGALMLDAMPCIVTPLFPLFDGRVLCSGLLGMRKPDRAIFEAALVYFDARAQETLFVDDLFVNVRAARAAGMHAETVADARSLRRVLRRYGLA